MTQWTDLFFTNPNASPINITIKVYSANNGGGYTNGQLLKTITKTIPAYNWYNTYGTSEWSLPDNLDAVGTQTLAWAEVTSSQAVVGMSRLRIAAEQK